ncbi:DUF1266 domain-containing protein [Paenibacillus sp. N1-5-1-14]|uniref:DUF1266 domain-containing protein n=1 Tax=Paenibacillus radicibacter TaxID=2972488 RepID=UPI002158EEAA|nr:DUF1266 domain-containing protein [Paenibacillus radicibacter]MCR8645330.1 DUF1266 domain-containing protein [Paenibacillus radicibacter]
MNWWKKRKEKQQQELYLQTLASICITGDYSYYLNYNLFNRSEWNKDILAQAGIEADRDEIRDKLDELLHGDGDNQWVAHTQRTLCALSKEQRIKYRDTFAGNPDHEHAIQNIDNVIWRYPTAVDLQSRHYAWCICIVRAAKEMRLIDDNDYWYFILKACDYIQSTYSGWHDYFGIQVYLQTGDDYYMNCKQLITRLFVSKNSPLHKLDWNMQLRRL